MAPNPSNSSNLEQLALNGLNYILVYQCENPTVKLIATKWNVLRLDGNNSFVDGDAATDRAPHTTATRRRRSIDARTTRHKKERRRETLRHVSKDPHAMTMRYSFVVRRQWQTLCIPNFCLYSLYYTLRCSSYTILSFIRFTNINVQ